jgi:2-haloalkanoic acid dehalogenase type II
MLATPRLSVSAVTLDARLKVGDHLLFVLSLTCSAPSTRGSKMKCKAVLFDFVGTCLDWHSTVVEALPPTIDSDTKSQFALQWRQQYFAENEKRVQQKLPVEDVDVTYRKALDITLKRYPDIQDLFNSSPEAKDKACRAWHHLKAWPEVQSAHDTLRKELGCELFVHANGSVRFQLDLTRSAGLHFDLLFSSELLGHYKPDPEAYLKAMRLLQLQPQDCVLVAAHAYDLRGAKAVGIKTVYVKRWTDDIDEDDNMVKSEFDAHLTEMSNLATTIKNL